MARKTHPHARPHAKPGSVKLKLDTRLFGAHLCGRTPNSVTVHIFRLDEKVECEPDARWEPRAKR